MTLKEVTRKINDLLGYYPDNDPTLEDVLVVFWESDLGFYIDKSQVTDNNIFVVVNYIYDFHWQLTKPFSQQSKETIETITKILNT